MTNSPLALLIMPDFHRVPLRGICNRLGIDTLEVETCQQTRELFATVPEIDLVVTDVTLPDGNWCDVLRCVVDNGSHTAVLLRCGTADEKLWSEALWRGVYDLVVEPYDAREVRRIVDGALRNRHTTSRTAATRVGQ